MNRKICVVVLSRANYGRAKSIIHSAHMNPEVELQLVVGASAIDELHGNVSKVIEADGYPITAMVDFLMSVKSPHSMATTTGLGVIKLSSVFDTLAPDVVVTIADRYETMATAIAATYQNICLAHLQGGEVTGSIDESVRHAITKLANIHFPATRIAAENIIRMGEDPSRVFHVGCPAMDPLFSLPPSGLESEDLTGVGFKINVTEPYLLVVYHPVTSEFGALDDNLDILMGAVTGLDMPTVWLWPNVDAGADAISKKLRIWREASHPKVRFIKNLPVDTYNALLRGAYCAVGNSSSFIREASILATPAVLVGSRQNRREVGPNLTRFEGGSSMDLVRLIEIQAEADCQQSLIYGEGDAGEKIVKILTDALPSTQKVLSFISE